MYYFIFINGIIQFLMQSIQFLWESIKLFILKNQKMVWLEVSKTYCIKNKENMNKRNIASHVPCLSYNLYLSYLMITRAMWMNLK